MIQVGESYYNRSNNAVQWCVDLISSIINSLPVNLRSTVSKMAPTVKQWDTCTHSIRWDTHLLGINMVHQYRHLLLASLKYTCVCNTVIQLA